MARIGHPELAVEEWQIDGGQGEYLSVHHTEEPDAVDDVADATAFALMVAAGGGLGDILTEHWS